ncbi:hypothetical protein N9224_00825 [Akkermansiaceae bacterium]|nr:hypothetical protein [Akkermansiaceae bacterium]
MTKADVITQLKAQFETKIATLKSALSDSEEGANGDETKSEGKYDTRAVEAAYLAKAQSEQLALAEKDEDIFKRFEAPAHDFSDEIQMGALVETDADGEIAFFYLAPTGGGMVIDFLGCELTVITPDSRLYQSLIGKKMGNTLESPALMVTGLE